MHTLDDRPTVVSIKPGTLDDTSWLPLPVHVFVSTAQPWEQFPDAATVYEGSSYGAVPIRAGREQP